MFQDFLRYIFVDSPPEYARCYYWIDYTKNMLYDSFYLTIITLIIVALSVILMKIKKEKIKTRFGILALIILFFIPSGILIYDIFENLKNITIENYEKELLEKGEIERDPICVSV